MLSGEILSGALVLAHTEMLSFLGFSRCKERLILSERKWYGTLFVLLLERNSMDFRGLPTLSWGRVVSLLLIHAFKAFQEILDFFSLFMAWLKLLPSYKMTSPCNGPQYSLFFSPFLFGFMKC